MNSDATNKTGDYPEGITIFHATYNKEKRRWENGDGVHDQLEAFICDDVIYEAYLRMKHGVGSPRDEDIMAYYFDHYPPTAHRIVRGDIPSKEMASEETAISTEAAI